MSKIKVIVFVCAILLIIYAAFFFLNKMQNQNNTFGYIPELQEFSIYDIKFKKIYADPSFIIPYNILISFRVDLKNSDKIIEKLGLKNNLNIDTVVLKSETWIDEYRLYFTMSSINAIRYKSIQNEVKKISWWKLNEEYNNNYASPYLDQNGKRGVVNFGEKNNGRITCYRDRNLFYLLIECWG